MRGSRTAIAIATTTATGRRIYNYNHKRNRITRTTTNSKANHLLLWRLVWIGIFAGGVSFLFVAPLLPEGNSTLSSNSNPSRLGISVHGFVTSPQTPQSQLQPQENGFTTMAMRKDMPTDEESPNEESSSPQQQQPSNPQQPPKMAFYKPSNPSDVQTFDYASNPTVFGSILRGELPTRLLTETPDCIAFQDISPKAPFHALVIPKRWIPSVFDLDPTNPSLDLSLVHQLSETAHTLLRERYPQAYQTGDYILCFHLPPFNSVDHLHLHVLAPASAMLPLYRHGKYNTGDAADSNHKNFGVRWCKSLDAVTSNLQKGLSPAMPYQRDDGWGTILSDLFQSVRSILFSSKGGGGDSS